MADGSTWEHAISEAFDENDLETIITILNIEHKDEKGERLWKECTIFQQDRQYCRKRY